MDAQDKLSRQTVALHWVIGISMIALIAFGLYIEELPKSPEKGELIGLHKSLGVLLLSLAILRLGWRVRNGFPTPLTTVPTWQERTAQVVHWLLLVGTIMIPVSGVMMSVGGGYPVGIFGLELIASSPEKNETLSQVGHVIHGLGSRILIAAVVLHVVGALKHQFKDRDGTMSRMLGRRV